MKIVYSGKCLSYPGYPESPDRVRNASAYLRQHRYKFIEPPPATEEDILRVHARAYVESVKTGVSNPDTPWYENIYEIALLSAGGAILAAKEKGFSLMRPPGHHAGRNGSALGVYTRGFCYFNSMAIAVKRLSLKTLIIDIDGHHGNGTQEIFLNNPKVVYISLHRMNIYPETGNSSEANCLNFPLPYDTGDDLYLKTLNKAISKVSTKDFEIVGISAGFDAHEGDLASLGLSSECYYNIGKKIKMLNLPSFGILEGGYSKHLGKSIDQLLAGLE